MALPSSMMAASLSVLVIPLAVDCGSWAPEADRLSAALAGRPPQVIIAMRLLDISGHVSGWARKEIEGRGFVVTDGTRVPLYE